MVRTFERSGSSLVSAIGLAVALVAIVGSVVLGWEWGDGRLVPAIIGVVAAAIAVAVLLTRRR